MREPTYITLKDGENELKIKITPMDAVRAERWLTRTLFIAGPALAGLTEGEAGSERILSALTEIDYEKAVPLWDELLTCCAFVSDGGIATDISLETLAGKVEYPTTIIAIKAAALKANFGFFAGGGMSKFLATMRGALTSQK